MEEKSIIEIVNEAVIKTETTELLTQKLILDACTCTGNCPKY